MKKPDKAYIRRVIAMIIAVFLMGIGLSLFKLSVMGNDPSTALCMAVSDKLGISLSIGLPMVNLLFFIGEIIWGRKYIGIGTVVNWFCVGYSTTFWLAVFRSLGAIPDSFPVHLAVMILGVLILSFAAALYQTADTGIAPYDSMSIIMADRLPIPYFWCRMITDSVCAIFAFLLGGLLGLGTLVCALGLGPFIHFFTEHAAKQLLGMKDKKA